MGRERGGSYKLLKKETTNEWIHIYIQLNDLKSLAYDIEELIDEFDTESEQKFDTRHSSQHK